MESANRNTVKSKKKLPPAEVRINKLKRAKKRRSKSGASALIDFILNFHGGPRAAAKLLTKELGTFVGEQTVTNWRIRGRVPLKLAPRAAKILDVPVYALNYRESCELYGKVEAWKGIVAACKILAPDSRKRVLSLAAPSEKK